MQNACAWQGIGVSDGLDSLINRLVGSVLLDRGKLIRRTRAF